MSGNKYPVKISDKKIEEEVIKGNFKEDGTLIRDVSSGQIVKVLKKKEESNNNIPSTFIQVHHNYIYQADLSPVLQAISHEKKLSVYNDLEEQYSLVLDYLDTFNTYETGIEKLHQICLEISVSFDNKIRREIQGLDVDKLEKIDTEQFIGSLNAYVKILFSYILSTYILHRRKFAKDKVIISKILSFEKFVRDLYEQLLVKSNQKNNDTYFTMENSLYSMYLFDDSYDISDLDRIVSQDSRFSTSLQVVGFFKKHKKSGNFSKQQPSYHYSSDDELKISISTSRLPYNGNRNKIAVALMNILEDTDKLKELREEIMNLERFSDQDVLVYFSNSSVNNQNQSSS
ncbi:MAG: hypothetical protein EOO53_14205 [Gammaproteobacteria bacterium]|nr:MAG: hypothetical protein EOO53_14205 [Gammaproteobacteria bacterium]